MNIKYFFSKLIKKMHIPAIKNSKLHKNSKVCSSSLVVNSKISRYSYVGNNCTIINTEIESFCSIADNCIIGGASHPIDWVSTSPVFHSGRNILRKNFSNHNFGTTKTTIIGNDVWIGNNCLIKSGVNIATGAIIGMGTVLTKDVGPYEIWGGNPAKMIRKRFEDHVINELIKDKWWKKNVNELEQDSELFNDVNKYLYSIKD